MSSQIVRSLAILVLLLVAGFAAAQTSGTSATGRRVEFSATPFRDTLFTAVDGAFRVRLDPAGHVWYTTEGGLVHVDPYNDTRELFTRVEGLPSSYTLGLAIDGDKVYVATDLGLGIVSRSTGAVARVMPGATPIPDQVVQDVIVLGDEVWMGTRFYGIAIWNTTKPATDEDAWTFKNTSTTADFAKPVRRISATPRAVWVATEGDGAWRFDRASKTWNVTLVADGLPDPSVLAIAERGDETWFGLPGALSVRNASGRWTTYNVSKGMPDKRVLDVDVFTTNNGTSEVVAATRKGLWQLDPVSGRNFTRAQSFGILGSYIFDDELASRGWLFATNRGISYLLDGKWRYYTSGPNTGPSNAPLSFGFTSASVGDSNGWVWFGTARGLSAYRLPSGGTPGWFQNFGEWQQYPGSVVNWIDTEGNVTWFGTNAGTYGFEHESGRWLPKLALNSRNLVYGLEADRGELWVGLFGDGLIMTNLTTGVTRSWDYQTVGNPIPDQYITDVRASGDTIWLGASAGAIKLDRATGLFRGTLSKAEGVPGAGVVFRLIPDGASLWVGTSDGGVARVDIGTNRVTRVWNATTTPGFPAGEVRALHREGARLWVGTTEGLARIDITNGEMAAWNQSSSGLVQNYVNGISSADGILYLATLSGIQRFDIAKGEFYPLRDGPGVVRGDAATSAAPGATRVTVRILSPRDGSAVTGTTQIVGSALAFGSRVDRVEVRIGNGAWQPAQGAEEWTFDWDTAGLATNDPIAVSARAFAGNATGETQITLTPIAPPKVPLRVEAAGEPGDAFAARALQFAARVEGDEPLTAALYYRQAGAPSYTRLPLTRQGNLFLGTIPARDVTEGELRYYFEGQSGLLSATAAGDANEPTVIAVAPAPRLAVSLEGPPLVDAQAGVEASFPLRVTNSGSEPAAFTLAASGLRAAWVVVPAEDIELAPGQSREVTIRVAVPTAAFADNTTLTFEARDKGGLADPALASVPLRIAASSVARTTPTSTSSGGGSVIPFPTALVLVAAALALAARRRP